MFGDWTAHSPAPDLEIVVRLQVSPSTIAKRQKVPFYENTDLLCFSDPSWPSGLRVYFLHRHDKHLFMRLDGNAACIHTFNGDFPPRIDEDTALDYLRFFNFFLRAEFGPFIIADSDEALGPLASYAVARSHITPAFVRYGDEGSFKVDATVVYSNCIFAARFIVYPSGHVEMRDDEPLAQLPHDLNTPIA